MAALTEMGRVTSRGGRVVVLDAVVDDVTDDALNDLARLRDPGTGVRTGRPPGGARRGGGLEVAELRLERRTVDLDYWLQAAARAGADGGARPAAGCARCRRRVQERLDLAFADDLVSFSYDVLALRLER